MTLFSANLGFLWAELPLNAAIHAAKKAGFDAVECHWPYETPASDIAKALQETGLEMLGLNTSKGDGFGLTALPDGAAAQDAIDEAIAYSAVIKAKSIHAMAGLAEGAKAEEDFINNLAYAATQAEAHGMTVLIEPINSHDVPGYFLSRVDHALEIIAKVNAPNLKIMFDIYHVAKMEADVIPHLNKAYNLIGHVQFAGIPHRGSPHKSALDLRDIFLELKTRGYALPLGAEYKPEDGDTDASLEWMQSLRV